MSDDLIERLRNPFTYENGEIDDVLAIAVMSEAADALAAKDKAISEMRAELAEALDDVKFAERIATKREIDANAERDEALRLLKVQIAGHKLSAKEATQNLIRATKAEAELKLWQDVKHSSHWKERATAAEAQLERVKAALRPFAGDKLPSSRRIKIAYNRHGLRCAMSDLEIAQDAAARALSQDEPVRMSP